MSWEPVVAAIIGGLLLGFFIAYVLKVFQARSSKEIAVELYRENEEQRKAQVEGVIQSVKDSFARLSLEALAKSTDEFLKLARARLESEREISASELTAKKNLIDQQLDRMNGELEKVSKIMLDLERDRIDKFGQLTTHLQMAGEQTAALMQTTQSLREALASTKVRGQWGERMAEDVLRIAGFIENVNYLKQTALDSGGSRPDFTFLLPRDLKLNMDVKFPLDNYLHYLEAESDAERVKFRDTFMRNVRDKIKEVTTRNYINAGDNTVDYVLLFIPNEHIYAFIHDQDSSLLDDGLRNKVIFCSPLTLFAILAVIRQAVDNFAIENTSKEILSLLGAFREQWAKFIEQLEKLGRRIGDVQKDYESLITTRRRQLERPLNKIEAIRTQQNLPIDVDAIEDLSSADEKED
jgi:DNA recombination protein RmuC